MTNEQYRATFDVEPGYLNWAAFGPLSLSVVSEVRIDADQMVSGRSAGIDMVTANSERALQQVSELLGVPRSWLTHQPSTSHALQQAIFGIRSGGVIASKTDWPAITLPITRFAEAFGQITPQWIEPEDGYVTADAISAALTPETTAVVVSLIDYRTGYRADLGAIREAIGPDRLLIVDAVQGFGLVNADYEAADVVAANGYKWLRAGRGTGWASFSDSAREKLRPVLSSTAGRAPGQPFDGAARIDESAQAFQVTNPDHLASARLVNALDDVFAVGLDEIEKEVGRRSAEIIAIADRFDIDILTPRGAAQRGGIVSLVPRNDQAAFLAATLTNDGLTVTARGNAVRVSVHAGTDDETLRMFEDAVAAFSQHSQ